jgi:hypothetical protein
VRSFPALVTADSVNATREEALRREPRTQRLTAERGSHVWLENRLVLETILASRNHVWLQEPASFKINREPTGF